MRANLTHNKFHFNLEYCNQSKPKYNRKSEPVADKNANLGLNKIKNKLYSKAKPKTMAKIYSILPKIHRLILFFLNKINKTLFNNPKKIDFRR